MADGIDQLDEYVAKSQQLMKLLLLALKKTGFICIVLIKTLAMYSILSYLYLTIYDDVGFEKTLIILLVAVIFFTLRQKNREAGEKWEKEQKS